MVKGTELCTHPLLEATELARGKRVGLTNDRDDVDTGRKPTHQLDVNLPQTKHMSDIVNEERRRKDVRVTSGGDEIKEGVYPVVPETGVAFDTGLLSENVIVLAFKVANDLLEANGGTKV